MRHAPLILTCMFGAMGLMPSAVLGQSADAPEVRFTDAVGDPSAKVRANQLQGPPIRLPLEQFAHIDIVEGWLGGETATAFELGAKFLRWHVPNGPPAPGGRTVSWYFSYGHERYQVTTPGGSSCAARISVWDSGPENFRAVSCATKREDSAARQLVVDVPKVEIVDENRVPFNLGRTLTAIFVEATDVEDDYSSPGFLSYRLNITDRAPDEGFRGPFRSQVGSTRQPSDLHLTSREPIRASNGESTTLVFPVSLVNQGLLERTVALRAETEESEFSVRVPARLRAPAGQAVSFPAILGMGFTHRHGEVGTFRVVAEDTTDAPHRGVVTLGVYWLDIPQPAGHHNHLWFHSAPGDGGHVLWTTQRKWMNTVRDDPNPGTTDDDVFASGTVEYGEATWSFPLAPPLRLGLAFDREQKGLLQVAIHSTAPMSSAVLNATLRFYCSGANHPTCPRSGPLVLASGRSQPINLPANGRTAFEIDLAVHSPVDVIPYIANSSLILSVRLTTPDPFAHIGPHASPLLITKSSSMRLPLLEYHDPVAQEFQAVGTVSLISLGPTERMVNPGEVAVFSIRVRNAAQGADTLDLHVEGHNAEWASIHGGTSLHVAGGDLRDFLVSVRAPEGAHDGERAEFFVVAASSFNMNVAAMTRLRASIVSSQNQDIENEAHLVATESRATASSSSALAILVLVAVATGLARARSGP